MMDNGVKGAENTPIDVHDNKAPHISRSPVLSSGCVSGLIEEGMQPRRPRVPLPGIYLAGSVSFLQLNLTSISTGNGINWIPEGQKQLTCSKSARLPCSSIGRKELRSDCLYWFKHAL
jgi:hypothetical protein